MKIAPKDLLAIWMKTPEMQSAGAVPEFRFHETRLWRFDFAFPDLKIAVEYDGHHESRGGVPGTPKTKSRHATLTGMSGDHEKFNAAQLAGWIVIRFTSLYFDGSARKKFKLSDPWNIIKEAIDSRKATGQDRDQA